MASNLVSSYIICVVLFACFPLMLLYSFFFFFLVIALFKKIVSEYYQEILQSQTADNQWNREEEPHSNHEPPARQTKQSNQFSIPHQKDCKTGMEIK